MKAQFSTPQYTARVIAIKPRLMNQGRRFFQSMFMSAPAMLDQAGGFKQS
jgi:hypothetical protein